MAIFMSGQQQQGKQHHHKHKEHHHRHKQGHPEVLDALLNGKPLVCLAFSDMVVSAGTRGRERGSGGRRIACPSRPPAGARGLVSAVLANTPSSPPTTALRLMVCAVLGCCCCYR
jgi:hypothetical protein